MPSLVCRFVTFVSGSCRAAAMAVFCFWRGRCGDRDKKDVRQGL
jgi:hypothetical protein